MCRVTLGTKISSISGSPCHVALHSRANGEHLGFVLSPRFRPDPLLNSRPRGNGNARTCLVSLPPRPPLAVNHHAEHLILPMGHLVCAIVGMTLLGSRAPATGSPSVQAHHGLHVQSADQSGSAGTNWADLGGEKQCAQIMQESVARRNRIAPGQLMIRSNGLARAVHEKHTEGETSLSRQGNFSIFMCEVENRVCRVLLPPGQEGYANRIVIERVCRRVFRLRCQWRMMESKAPDMVAKHSPAAEEALIGSLSSGNCKWSHQVRAFTGSVAMIYSQEVQLISTG